ncbi:hypothetical protein D8674_020485 [Pyrus ussuriensis x Pyrus communis]|uniref:Uncharacterized protein n=1 Tax=Pyrus ussuriensis x Pyrus communis TaxID=2448454 RepID=A0A5N5HJ66_9ROSA|nr:hypothetical protein D8674_020485 [Pyrus ussuriensis x Pyrus communis]
MQRVSNKISCKSEVAAEAKDVAGRPSTRRGLFDVLHMNWMQIMQAMHFSDVDPFHFGRVPSDLSRCINEKENRRKAHDFSILSSNI